MSIPALCSSCALCALRGLNHHIRHCQHLDRLPVVDAAGLVGTGHHARPAGLASCGVHRRDLPDRVDLPRRTGRPPRTRRRRSRVPQSRRRRSALDHRLLGEELNHLRCRSRRLRYRLRDVLGAPARPPPGRPPPSGSPPGATWDAPRCRSRTGRPGCGASGPGPARPARQHRRRQHHQVRLHLHRPAHQRIRAPDHHPVAPAENPAHLAPEIEDVVLLHRPLDELVVPLPAGADVNVEDVGLPLRGPAP